MEVSKISSVQNQSLPVEKANSINFGYNEDLLNSKADADTFELSSENAINAPEVSPVRIFFHRFTKEQVNAVNDLKELPKGSKFVEATDLDGVKTGRPVLTWNLFGITSGTRKMPAGYELKNDILGFTHVVREGTEGIFYPKD